MTTLSRRGFLAGLGAGAACCGWSAEPAKVRPNILFIMSDDHASHAISAYDDRLIQTPHLDRLAKEGCLFTRVFATNAICTPSRASILTGQYSHVNGVPVFNKLDPSKITVAHRLQRAGYYTVMIGKWHLGSDPQGFDHWEILPGQGAYFDPVLYTREGSKRYGGEYCTDVVTRLAIERLRTRPKDRPFFMMMHHKAPHRPWQPAPRHNVIWHNKTIPEPSTLFDTYVGRADPIREQKQSIARDLTKTDLKEDVPEGLVGEARTRWCYQRYMQDYLGCIQGVDESVGRILDELDALGLAENTVVIYTSDQGFFLGDHGLYDKRFMYEESLKMPFLMRWPKGIRAGIRQNALAINCDFAPTFLALAGEEIPREMQGKSMVPLLGGTIPDGWRKSLYYRYYHDPGDHNTARHYGVRTETHKLIYFDKKDQWECYDLTKDPEELDNIYNDPAAQPIVAALKAELLRLKKELGDDDRYADSKEWPKASSYVKPPPPKKCRVRKTVDGLGAGGGFQRGCPFLTAVRIPPELAGLIRVKHENQFTRAYPPVLTGNMLDELGLSLETLLLFFQDLDFVILVIDSAQQIISLPFKAPHLRQFRRNRYNACRNNQHECDNQRCPSNNGEQYVHSKSPFLNR